MPGRGFLLDEAAVERLRRVMNTVEGGTFDSGRGGPDYSHPVDRRLVVTTTAVQPNNTTPLPVTRWTDTATTVLPTATTLTFTAYDWNGWGFEKNYKATAFRPLPSYKWYCDQPPAARYGVVSGLVTTRASASVCDTVPVNPSTDCAGVGRDTETTFTIKLPNRTGNPTTLTIGDVITYMPQLGGDLVAVSPYQAQTLTPEIFFGRVASPGVSTSGACDTVPVHPSTDCAGSVVDTNTTRVVSLPRRTGIGPNLTPGNIISYTEGPDSTYTIISDYSEASSGMNPRWGKVHTTWTTATVGGQRCWHVDVWPTTNCDGDNPDTDTTLTIFMGQTERMWPQLSTGDVIGFRTDENGNEMIVTDYSAPSVILRIRTGSDTDVAQPVNNNLTHQLWDCYVQTHITSNTTKFNSTDMDGNWDDQSLGYCFSLNNRMTNDNWLGNRDRYIGHRIGTHGGRPLFAIRDTHTRYPLLVTNAASPTTVIPPHAVMEAFIGEDTQDQWSIKVVKPGGTASGISRGRRWLVINSEYEIPVNGKGWAAVPGPEPLKVLTSTGRMSGANYSGRKWFVDPTSENWALVSDSSVTTPADQRFVFWTANFSTASSPYDNMVMMYPSQELMHYGVVNSTITIDSSGCVKFSATPKDQCAHTSNLLGMQNGAAATSHVVYLPSTDFSQHRLAIGDKVFYHRMNDDTYGLVSAGGAGSTAATILWAKASTHWTYASTDTYPTTYCPTVACNPCTDCDGNGVQTGTTFTIKLPTWSTTSGQVRTDPNVETGNVIGYIQDALSQRIAVVGWDGDAIGSMKMWVRSSNTTQIQQGWRVMDGTANAAGSAGVKSGSGYDMRNFFPRGAGNTEFGATSGSSVLTKDQLLHSHPMPNTPQNVDINLDGLTTFVTRYTTLCTGNPTQNNEIDGTSDTSLQACGTQAWGPLPIMNPHRGIYFIERINNAAT